MGKLNKYYAIGFFIILTLPLLVIPPWFFPPDFGKTIIFRSILVILLCIFAWQFFYKQQCVSLSAIKKNPIIVTLGALFLTFLLATIFSVNPYFSFWGWPIRAGGFINFAGYIILAVLAFLLFKKNDWKKAWDFSIIIGALVALVTIAQYFNLLPGILMEVEGRPSSTMGNPILLGIYLLLLFFLTLAHALQEKTIWKKGCYIAILMLFFCVILITQSRAAYLGLFIGGIYFLVAYPKKIRFVKTIAGATTLLIIGTVFYVNLIHQYPEFLQNNRLFTSIEPRLLIKNLVEDTRFTTLGIAFDSIGARPILGYGLENFSVGFDKHYNAPSSLTGIVGWWDRAHNIVMQTLSDAGILGLAAYLALFGILFWQLHKAKKRNTESALLPHAIATTLIGYGVALLFSFDSFSTYLIFFLLVGYSLHITNSDPNLQITSEFTNEKNWLKNGAMIALLCIGIVFLWQYNFKPLYINAKINQAEYLIEQRNCGQGLTIMEKALQEHSFLDSYARLKYVAFTTECNEWYPENKIDYLKKGVELITQAATLQPHYTRYWIFLGNAMGDIANQEKNETIKTALILQAYGYLDHAMELAPKHPEVPIAKTRVAIAAQDYQAAMRYAQQCIDINTDLGECYFYLALSQIYVKNMGEAQKNLEIASKNFGISSKASLEQLANAYGSLMDYQNLASVYEKLIEMSPDVAQYHSSLAFFYRETGRYQQAREQALEVLRISPESKENVEAFLRTLPR